LPTPQPLPFPGPLPPPGQPELDVVSLGAGTSDGAGDGVLEPLLSVPG
jgi:hypothetical protein